jgi:hypothetical protein
MFLCHICKKSRPLSAISHSGKCKYCEDNKKEDNRSKEEKDADDKRLYWIP